MKTQTDHRLLLGYNQFLAAEHLSNGGYFSLSAFEDWNKLIESVVLYDKIVLLGAYSLPTGLLAKPLSDAGVIETLSVDEVSKMVVNESFRRRFHAGMAEMFGSETATRTTPEQLLVNRIAPSFDDSRLYLDLFNETIACAGEPQFDRAKLISWLRRLSADERRASGGFFYLARAILYNAVAEESGLDYAPDLIRLPITALAFTRGSRPLTRALYDTLVAKIRSEIDGLVVYGMPIAVFVPPLSAALLMRGPEPKDYAQELMTLRERFAGYRTAYAEFKAILQDPEATLKEKIDAKKQMMTRISGVIEAGESRHSLNVRTLWEKLIDSSLDESGISSKVSLSGMVSLLLDQLSKERVRGQARALFDLWTDTMNLKNYGQLLERSFNARVDEREAGQFKAYSEAVRSLMIAREGILPSSDHS